MNGFDQLFGFLGLLAFAVVAGGVALRTEGARLRAARAAAGDANPRRPSVAVRAFDAPSDAVAASRWGNPTPPPITLAAPPPLRPARAGAKPRPVAPAPGRLQPAPPLGAPVRSARSRFPRTGSPWADAFVAGEIFGPPVAARPDGTPGSPKAL